MKLTIGLSYAPEANPKYGNYRRAVETIAKAMDYDVEVIELSDHPSAIEQVDAVIFTGGTDIQPSRYGKQEEEGLCGEIIESRDQAEFDLADRVEQKGLPVLGICRGMQLLNVHRGGTLVTDIQNFGGRDHKRIADGQDSRHRVKVTPGSYLSRVLGRTNEGEINSAHHQAVERVGDGLVITARAEEDGTAEAMEWADQAGKPFFLAVQWHPERMQYDERFSGRIFETFLWEVATHKALKDRIGVLNKTRSPEPPEAESATNGFSQNGHDSRS